MTVDESVGSTSYSFSFGPATKSTQEEFSVFVETFDLVPTEARGKSCCYVLPIDNYYK